MTLENDFLLHNRYRILGILGRGGMGAVYQAVDESLGVNVAVKENLIDDQVSLRQFKREATVLANLRHPNLPRVTDHFVIEGKGQYLVMDFVQGEDLKERLMRENKLPEKEVILIGVAICDALIYLHNLDPPVIHRDIKPGNIKIAPAGEVYLVDFGLVKVARDSQATTSGARGLTPGFSPPEQYGTGRTDGRSDIYALGATLYAALTGTAPEDGLAIAINQTQLTKVRDRSPKTSRQLSAAIEKALSVQSEDRYQIVDEFKQALIEAGDAATQEEASGVIAVTPPPQIMLSVQLMPDGTAVPVPGPAPTLKSRRRFPWLVISSVIVIGAIAVSAVIFEPRLLSRDKPSVAGPESTQNPTSSVQDTQSADFSPAETSTADGETLLPDPDPPGPTPTGGSAQIAFVSLRSGRAQIWMVGLDGSEPVQVTDVFGGACQPAWSPDGQTLVFISPCIKNQQAYEGTSLYIINPDGTGLAPLTSGDLGDYDPDWSPTENKIVFTTIREFNRPQINILDLDTGDSYNISNNVVWDFQPVWAPDGEKIAFASIRVDGSQQIWVMDPDGGNVIDFSQSANKMNLDPEWFPDGEMLVFAQLRPNGTGRPHIIAIPWDDGGEQRGQNEYQISDDPSGMREPDFSPDGNWLVFSSNPDGENHDIYIMRTDGTEIQRITIDLGLDFDPVWQPDPNLP